MEAYREYMEIALKLTMAVVLGGLVGFEREYRNRPAGLRTHIILCVGATLLTIVSISMSRDLGNERLTDPTRIAAQIVSGIGFLGGGAILRLGATVKGLTTAAAIWTVTGVGMAVGAGYFFAAIMVVLIMLFTLRVLARFESRFIKKRMYREMTLVARSSPDLLGSVEKVLAANRVFLKNIEVEREISEPNVELRAIVTAPEHVNLNKLSDEIFQIPGTLRFEME
jgi:putative Mg2+ transporter-C (MgtC) family protein